MEEFFKQACMCVKLCVYVKVCVGVRAFVFVCVRVGVCGRILFLSSLLLALSRLTGFIYLNSRFGARESGYATMCPFCRESSFS